MRPFKGTEFVMTVQAETDNPYDKFACLVKAPGITSLPTRIWDLLTRESKSTSGRQSVREVAGATVGRVPKDLCKILSRGIQITRTCVK